jgi:hypothetical protein
LWGCLSSLLWWTQSDILVQETVSQVFRAGHRLDEGEQISGRIQLFSLGGYILYRAWPEQHVFIDGQTDFYGESLTRQYETVLTQSEGWRQVLADYGVRWVLMPVNAGLARALESEEGWRIRYQDPTAVVLVYEP